MWLKAATAKILTSRKQLNSFSISEALAEKHIEGWYRHAVSHSLTTELNSRSVLRYLSPKLKR